MCVTHIPATSLWGNSCRRLPKVCCHMLHLYIATQLLWLCGRLQGIYFLSFTFCIRFFFCFTNFHLVHLCCVCFKPTLSTVVKNLKCKLAMLAMNAALRFSFLLRLCKQRELTKLINALRHSLDFPEHAINMYNEHIH